MTAMSRRTVGFGSESVMEVRELTKWGVSWPSEGCVAAPREVRVRPPSNFRNTKKKKKII
jgi:hypothetical protein